MSSKNKSLWRKEVNIPGRAAIGADIKADVAVVGCGMAGALIAYKLRQRGLNVVVLEADVIASGQTQNTTAKITSQHNLIYNHISSKISPGAAALYAEANQNAIRSYEKLIADTGIACDFEKLPACLYSFDSADALEAEYRTAVDCGIDAELQEGNELSFLDTARLPTVLKFKNQAMFHPLKFLRRITDELTVYERSLVKDVNTDRLLVSVPSGREYTVTAPRIVFANHYPFINSPGLYFLRMHQERSYVLALNNAPRLSAMYLGIDGDGHSLRNAGDFLLLGGGSHRTGENQDGGKYDKLEKAASAFFPSSEVAAHWSAQDCITIDKIPYIGRYSHETPDWFTATGFGKWGMTSSMVSAELISDLICGDKNPYEDLYTPQRFDMSASAKSMVEDGVKSVEGLVKNIMTAGEMHCTHLGCKLERNPDENILECPCHGSCFSEDGKLQSGPAMHDL